MVISQIFNVTDLSGYHAPEDSSEVEGTGVEQGVEQFLEYEDHKKSSRSTINFKVEMPITFDPSIFS